MMMTAELSVKRLLTVGDKESFANAPFIYTDEPAYIEPASPEIMAIYDGLLAFETYTAFIDGILDIREGDQLTDAVSGNVYLVRGKLRNWHNIDIQDMTGLVIVKAYHAQN